MNERGDCMKRIISIAILVVLILSACGEAEPDISVAESETSSESFESVQTAESSEIISAVPEQSEHFVSEEVSEESDESSKPEEIYQTPQSIVSSPILFWDTEDRAFKDPVFIGGVNKDGFHSPEEFIYNGKHLYSLCDIYGEAVETNAVEPDQPFEFFDSFGSKTEAISGKSYLYHEDALPLYLITNDITVDKKPQSRFLIGSLSGESIFLFPEAIENGKITIDLNRDGESEKLYLETKNEQEELYSLNIVLESSDKTIYIDKFQYAAISSEKVNAEFFFADIDSDSEYEIISYFMFNNGRESFISIYDLDENRAEILYAQTIHYLN